ncbi:Threonylcarbamoyladenosine tRNA methylthiotransferase-like [Oopsacas minuta]|uniref:tRNA-t(6)A37 methylthiotransferase n=1 Tax=Oopsacas minuta TaxID=111878 RepID=A0AAV7JWE6_9METZ|nr:Threonylcarbamoyladenosine tRNA methylthiotransferase-like [Oopsacas minuta]
MVSCAVMDIEDYETPKRNINRRNINHSLVLKSIEKGENEVKLSDLENSNIPGVGSIYLKTWGCSHNHSDAEYMAGQLASYGYTITEDKETADLWLLNSCTVKTPSEDGFKNFIREAKSRNKFVVVAGCVPQADRSNKEIQGISVVGVQQIDRVVEVVEETLKGNSVRLFKTKKLDGKKIGGARLDLPKIRKNPLIEIIAINTGCLNNCTYCKTKLARGDLGSYQPKEIVARAVEAFADGVVELWLTSEDLGAYGHDIGVALPELLWKLIDIIPDGCMMRLGMTNPPYILEHLKEMSEILNNPKVYSFLHIPVQAGSDRVLDDMKREYTAYDFYYIVDYLKQRIPEINIATDIICGFPTETDEDFAETLKLCDKYKFSSLFINQFYPRPGTVAAKMKRLPTHEVKKRSKQLTELFNSYKPYSHKIGESTKVLVTEIAHDKLHYVGHNKYYEQVLLPMREDIMGKQIQVRISGAGKHHMDGILSSQFSETINTSGGNPHRISHQDSVSHKRRIYYYFILFVLFVFVLLLQFGYVN